MRNDENVSEQEPHESSPDELTIGELTKKIRSSGLNGLRLAFMLAALEEKNDPRRAAIYNACWVLLGPQAAAGVKQDSGQVAFAFTMSADVLNQLRTALAVRKMASETWGLTEAFLARILTCLEQGKLTHEFDRVKRQG